MNVCSNFIDDNRTTSATKCRNCGCEKWEHLTEEQLNASIDELFITKELDKYLNVLTLMHGDKESIQKLEELMNEELRKSGFVTTKDYFIK